MLQSTHLKGQNFCFEGEHSPLPVCTVNTHVALVIVSLVFNEKLISVCRHAGGFHVNYNHDDLLTNKAFTRRFWCSTIYFIATSSNKLKPETSCRLVSRPVNPKDLMWATTVIVSCSGHYKIHLKNKKQIQDYLPYYQYLLWFTETINGETICWIFAGSFSGNADQTDQTWWRT